MKGNKTKQKIKRLCYASLVCAIYVALTYLSMLAGLDKGAVQVRFSEALCVLPVFFPESVAGLFVGCLLANLLTGGFPLDIVLGSLATLIGACGAYAIGRLIQKRGIKNIFLKCLVPLPTVISNTVIVPFVIYFCYLNVSERTLSALLPIAFSVLAGEIISAGLLGMLLYFAVEKNKRFFKI